MPRRWTWIALALPLVVIALAIAKAELFLRHAEELSLPIEGYDPRDLLKGHYLQFRLALDRENAEEREACDAKTERCCWCLRQAEDEPVARVERATCQTARTFCDGALTLTAAEKPFRFYVPEGKAQQMERELREAREGERAFAVFAIEGEGEARVIGLRLGEKRYGK